jgi:hypothetical protein
MHLLTKKDRGGSNEEITIKETDLYCWNSVPDVSGLERGSVRAAAS